jgi:asparagine synthase (glutamine-hydrolysing)
MCGIAGLVSPGYFPEAMGVVERMVAKLRHRGPDGNGVVRLGANAVLGHARLSIVDLESGAQPMSSPDRKLAVTFNGEIYGYRELKARQDYPFRTESDTEVLLALYNRHGKDMVRHLPGMFAFAIWDAGTHTLFCARDRFGEKPFYFVKTSEGGFLFASEIKAILASGLVDPVVEMGSVAHYLWQNHIPSSASVYSNIHVLPPAHSLILHKGKLEIRRYWNFPEVDEGIDPVEAAERFSELLQNAVRKQLVADVPVSGFLSAGLDSTTIMALASKAPNPPKAFSFDFQTGDSEADTAENSSARYGLDFQRIEIERHDPAELLETLVEVYDEPFADSSAIPTYLISRAASRYAKVALTGDGGDEMTGGYDYFYQPLLDFNTCKRLEKIGKQVHQFAALLWRLGFQKRAARTFQIGERIGEFRNHKGIPEALLGRRACFTPAQVKRLLRNHGKFDFQPAGGASGDRTLDAVFRCDIEGYMAGQILVKTDRASMAHGLELRSPFLDVEVAEFLLGLPARLKIVKGRSKWILREAFESLWSASVSKGPKRGFDSPLEVWLQGSGFQKLIWERLRDPRSRIWTILAPENLEVTLQNLTPQQTYNLLNLSIWMEKNEAAYCRTSQ